MLWYDQGEGSKFQNNDLCQSKIATPYFYVVTRSTCPRSVLVRSTSTEKLTGTLLGYVERVIEGVETFTMDVNEKSILSYLIIIDTPWI